MQSNFSQHLYYTIYPAVSQQAAVYLVYFEIEGKRFNRKYLGAKNWLSTHLRMTATWSQGSSGRYNADSWLPEWLCTYRIGQEWPLHHVAWVPKMKQEPDATKCYPSLSHHSTPSEVRCWRHYQQSKRAVGMLPKDLSLDSPTSCSVGQTKPIGTLG